MATITRFMSDDHERCDTAFTIAEQAVADGDWSAAREATTAFIQAVEGHFAMEEQVLFPALERIMGAEIGPTQVMRLEHEQMRALFGQLAAALEAHDSEAFLGAAETLLILMQQHNAKEEQILYPLSDRMLPSGEGVIGEMQQLLC